MLIRIVRRLIIASIASLLFTAAIIAIRNFHLHLWKSLRLGNNRQSQIESGILTDSMQLPDVVIDEGGLRPGVLQADNTPEAEVRPLLYDNKNILSHDRYNDDAQSEFISFSTAPGG